MSSVHIPNLFFKSGIIFRQIPLFNIYINPTFFYKCVSDKQVIMFMMLDPIQTLLQSKMHSLNYS